MARIKGAVMTRKRRNKVLKAAKGYWGAKSKHFKMAKQAVMKSGNYAPQYPFAALRTLFLLLRVIIAPLTLAIFLFLLCYS